MVAAVAGYPMACILIKRKDDDFEDVQHGLTILVSREDAPILMGTKLTINNR